jgi:hypothetical protein
MGKVSRIRWWEAMREAKDIMMTESMIVIMTRTDNETEPEAGKPGHQ